MLIDSHSHLNFAAYAEDIGDVLERMENDSVKTVVVGTAFETSQGACSFVKDQEGMWAAVGYHPSHIAESVGYIDAYVDENEGEVAGFDAQKLRMLLERDSNGKIVAIGECGLDYYRLPDDPASIQKTKAAQLEAFEAQIALAREFNKAVIVHLRGSVADPEDAYHDCIGVIRNSRPHLPHSTIIHSFTQSVALAREFVDLGCYLGFNGIVTFKKADSVRESARYCPKGRLLTETDCPYLAPEPFRGKRNEPAYVREVLRKLEEIRGERLEDQIVENFEKAFKIQV